MKRTGRTPRKKRNNAARLNAGRLAGPVGIVALGLAVVFAVGYWVRQSKPADGGKRTAQGTPGTVTKPGGTGGSTTPGGTGGSTTPGGTGGSTTPGGTGGSTTPGGTGGSTTPGGTGTPAQDSAVISARAHINHAGGASGTMLVTAYYVDGLSSGHSLQPVQIQVPQTEGKIQAAVQQVINAPMDLKLFSGVPAGTRVRGATFSPSTGVAVVDLSAEAGKVASTADANSMMAALVYSVTEIPGVKSLQLWTVGNPAVIGGIEWNKPLSRADISARNLFAVQSVIKYEAKP